MKRRRKRGFGWEKGRRKRVVWKIGRQNWKGKRQSKVRGNKMRCREIEDIEGKGA